MILNALAASVLDTIAPSGSLTTVAVVADATTNPELDEALDKFDAIEAALQKHLENQTLMARLEDDFARCVPALADAAIPLEAWAIPLLSALAGPAAPLLSFGMLLACKVALAALTSWSKKRLAAKPA